MDHSIFISYSSADKGVADQICASLEGSGIGCWIAPRDIKPGEACLWWRTHSCVPRRHSCRRHEFTHRPESWDDLMNSPFWKLTPPFACLTKPALVAHALLRAAATLLSPS